MSALIGIKTEIDANQGPTDRLTDEVKRFFKDEIPELANAKNLKDILLRSELRDYIEGCIDLTNKKAISKA